MAFCDTTSRIGGSFRTDGNERTNERTDERTPDGQTDVEVEIVI